MSNFAMNLKKFRKQKGYSQVKLAKYINYGSTAIANYENNRNEPSFDTLIELAHILGITTDELLGVPYRSDEQQLLSDYKKLSPEDQQLISGLIKSLLCSTR